MVDPHFVVFVAHLGCIGLPSMPVKSRLFVLTKYIIDRQRSNKCSKQGGVGVGLGCG